MSKFKVGDRVVPSKWIAGFLGIAEDAPLEVLDVRMQSHGQQVLVAQGRGWSCSGHFSFAPTASPIRTITRREIVPGEYDGVVISRDSFSPSILPYIAFKARAESQSLRAAAALFNELADVLDENAGVR